MIGGGLEIIIGRSPRKLTKIDENCNLNSVIKVVSGITHYRDTGELFEIMYLFMSSLRTKEHEQLYLARSIM